MRPSPEGLIVLSVYAVLQRLRILRKIRDEEIQISVVAAVDIGGTVGIRHRDAVVLKGVEAMEHRRQIGRASCRERVLEGSK